MLVTIRVVLIDGREVEIAREIRRGEQVSPAYLLERSARNGFLQLSDSEQVPLAWVVRVEFAQTDAPAGPGWVRGLQDEDAAAAAASGYADEGHPNPASG
jgi:hypothetical protein